MSTAIWVVIAIVIAAVLVAAAYLARARSRSARLRRRFGPEYERTVESAGSRAAAERELRSREQRHERLELHDLDPRRREQYREQWVRVQERFVDTPEAAVEQAGGLVTVVMGERGYPTHGFEDKVAHLSVEHGRTMDHYRRAHAISGKASSKEASTEDLRQAMVHYRALFEELLAPHDGRRPAGRAAEERSAGEHTADEPKGEAPRVPPAGLPPAPPAAAAGPVDGRRGDRTPRS
ncbi:hypothetical protein ACQPZP_20315 [Spirillospora sp. CA-142024]|uniref:hypothetical protein n=1 Tax=Spirillospora sp. CA-142024 TaxID=3240036 RepID=UPI003D8B649F